MVLLPTFVIMVFRVLTWIILGAVIYRLLNRYVLPIFHLSASANHRLKDMQRQMHELDKKMDKNNKNSRKREGDFIDYEEIK